MSRKSPEHNLDLSTYSLADLLNLFEISRESISQADMRRAKHQVLMLHPDKSQLPKEYFLFYKRAFDLIGEFYSEQTRTTRHVPKNAIEYDAGAEPSAINSAINDMNSKEFNTHFNRVFEELAEPPRDLSRNDWFTSAKPCLDMPAGPVGITPSNMAAACDRLRVHGNAMTRYTGVTNLAPIGQFGELYDTDVDEYLSSDPFSKLKFDDLRKVHKDQTLLPVSDRGFVAKPITVAPYSRESIPDPMTEQEALRVLDRDSAAARSRLMEKEFESKRRLEQSDAKNKSMLAAFLRLGMT